MDLHDEIMNIQTTTEGLEAELAAKRRIDVSKEIKTIHDFIIWSYPVDHQPALLALDRIEQAIREM